ncbi:MAG: Gfo/Idh/MocA family oxidoreductase [Akkermansiaceae bacterium]|nr:Gfo/Idh/MocA family oxidoreductase [Verrucomicrobiales bacterium]
MNSKPSASKLNFNRRQFLKTASLAAGAVTFGVPALLRGQNLNSKLNIAAIGAAGKGQSDTDLCAGENIVALCDVDRAYCAGQLKKYPAAKYFQDFRKMLDEMGKSIDAVTISTPDHFHAVATSAAIKQGKHVYCQKPLTQTIHEARQLRDLAREHKIVSQMGNQGSAEDGLRRAVEVIQAGAIGPVREVHVWSNRPFWPQGIGRPEGADPVPADLDWDLWVGPAALRPYKKGVYHTWNWRGWLDFGTGALGDMACHTVNMPFRALKLGYPSVIEAESSGMNGETYPLSSKIRFEFPARGGTVQVPEKGAQALIAPPDGTGPGSMAPMNLFWYDGGKPSTTGRGGHDGSNKPAKEITADVEKFRGDVPGSGCLIIGDNGQIFSDDDYGTRFFVKLKGEDKFTFYQKHPAIEPIPVSLPRNPFKGDADARHHLEWIQAIKDNKPEMCYSRFDITAYLTEIMLLGCVAMRVGKKLEWDGPGMHARNVPEAARFVKRDNRAPWIAG